MDQQVILDPSLLLVAGAKPSATVVLAPSFASAQVKLPQQQAWMLVSPDVLAQAKLVAGQHILVSYKLHLLMMQLADAPPRPLLVLNTFLTRWLPNHHPTGDIVNS
jgi:hypothetical protein